MDKQQHMRVLKELIDALKACQELEDGPCAMPWPVIDTAEQLLSEMESEQ